MMTKQQFDKILTSAVKFVSLANAESYAYNSSSQLAWIVMGDDQRYWVVRPADAERLIRAGYELA